MNHISQNVTNTSSVDGSEQHIHLRAGGVSLVVSRPDGRIPTIAHWGADLGKITAQDARTIGLNTQSAQIPNCPDAPMHVGIIAEPRWGWAGRPGLVGHRDRRHWAPDLRVHAVRFHPAQDSENVMHVTEKFAEMGPGRLEFQIISPHGLELTLAVELTPQGVLRARATVTNTAPSNYYLEELNLNFPVPITTTEIQDFAGHWGQERRHQRHAFTVGTHMREGRKGRTGADSAHMVIAGENGFGFRTGQVWGIHTGFSGNHRTWAEREYSGHRVLGGGELLLPGEIVLSERDSYTTPWIYGVFGHGLDDQAHRLHEWIRARPQHPKRPRPATLNVWEAVYFDHNLTTLRTLADLAADAGIERFVLDDGWFGSRRDDTSGLGDWVVSPDVWPEGLGPIIEHVNALGMEFGLWFEPEMINMDSDLARAHPEWVLAPDDRLPISSRFQQVLDLDNPDAYSHVREHMVALLDEYNIGYIKWDHNRDLLEAGSSRDGAPGVHQQTLAAYRLMHELKERFPQLEIESCASGGARVDLGILDYVDRFWTSDCVDPGERQHMHRWTQQLIPPELMGSHIAAGHSHQTGRLHPLNFRAGTALWGHCGVEWDLTQATEAELAELARWVELYKNHRHLLHHGSVVRMDLADSAWDVHGVVSADHEEAIFAVVCTGISITDPVGRLALSGLCPERYYAVTDITPESPDADFGPPPGWPDGSPIKGSVLQQVGLHSPNLRPDRIRLLHLTAVCEKSE